MLKVPSVWESVAYSNTQLGNYEMDMDGFYATPFDLDLFSYSNQTFLQLRWFNQIRINLLLPNLWLKLILGYLPM